MIGLRNAQPDRPYQLSVSIGVAASDPATLADVEQLLHRTDAQMYRQKHGRRRTRELPRPTYPPSP